MGSSLPEAGRRIIAEKVPSLSRRDFLTLSTAGIGSVVGAWISSKTKLFENKTVIKAVEEEPFNRLLLRLHGMFTNLHPEEPLIFVRNALQALKLKAFAKYLKETGILHPTVPFDFGAMHSGIEDLITLPDDILRLLIAYANRSYIGQTIQKYGAEAVATTRLFQADESGTFRDLPPLIDQKLKALLSEIEPPPKQPSTVSNRPPDR